MQLLILSIVSATMAAVVPKSLSKPAVGSTPTGVATQANGASFNAKVMGEGKAGRMQQFIERMQGQVVAAEAKANQVRATGGSERKASRLARAVARKAGRKAAKKDVAAIQKQTTDPAAEEVFSLSASASAEFRQRENSHFSFSESEHYRDCTTSSGSHCDHKDGCKHKAKKGYRLRHCRLHCEESHARGFSISASASASLDIDDIEASASASLSFSKDKRHRTVFRVCEDELARKKKHCNKRCGEDEYVRVDYRKKVVYDDNEERELSVSGSLSLSIDAEVEAAGGLIPSAATPGPK